MKKWYYYEEDEVQGPFSEEDLIEHITPETLICPAGNEDWNPAADYPDIKPYFEKQTKPEESEPEPTAPAEPGDQPDTAEKTQDEEVDSTEPSSSQPASAETTDDKSSLDETDGEEQMLEPTLDTLTRITREANAEDLLREFKHHWNEYDREEQQILYLEMKHLGILPDQDE